MVLRAAVKEPAEVCHPCCADKLYMTLITERRLFLFGASNNPDLSWSKSDLVLGAQPRAHHGISEECHFAFFLWERTTSPFLQKRGRVSLKRNPNDTALPSSGFSSNVLSNDTSSCPTCSQLLTVRKNPCWAGPQPLLPPLCQFQLQIICFQTTG